MIESYFAKIKAAFINSKDILYFYKEVEKWIHYQGK